MKRVRFGVIGLGIMGSAHVKTMLGAKDRDFCLAAVADSAGDRARTVGEANGVAWFDEPYKMLDSGQIDAVLLATPHYFHPPQAVYAARRGIHILTEKPLAVTVGVGRLMVEECRKAGVALGVMFQHRTHPAMKKMHQIIASGGIGAPFRASMICSACYRTQAYYDSGSWRGTWNGEGGGILLNQAPHSLDILQWVYGLPRRVLATVATRQHHIEVENTANALLEYDGNRTGYIYATTAEVPGLDQIMVAGDKGTVVVEAGKLRWAKLKTPLSKHMMTSPSGFDKPEVRWTDVPTSGAGGEHLAVIKAFASHLLKGTPLVATGRDGVNGLELSNAIYISGYRRKAVDLPVRELEMERLLTRLARQRGAGEGGNIRLQARRELRRVLSM